MVSDPMSTGEFIEPVRGSPGLGANHYCRECGGWIAGMPERRQFTDPTTREGTIRFNCRRCGRPLKEVTQ